MPSLVLNACEGLINIVIAEQSSVLCSQAWQAPTRGTELLTPILSSTLQRLELKPQDLERIACVHGPGSFTGIRLILSTVAAMRRVLHIPVAGISYMQALACTGQQIYAMAGNTECDNVKDSREIWVITHARRDLVHCQNFSFGNADVAIPQPMQNVWLCSPQVAYETMQNAPSGSIALGSGFAKHAELFAQGLDNLRILPIISPNHQALLTLANQATYAHEDLEPLYIRPCDAVENLEYIAKKQGKDAVKVMARFEELSS